MILGGVTRRRFDQLPEPRRAEILVVAAREFATNGFQGTSYNRLLTRIGLGKGSAYYYFADKQELFLTVVKACYRAFFDSIAGLELPTTADGYWDYVEQLNRRGLDFMVDDRTAASVLTCFRNERAQLDLLTSAGILDSLDHDYRELLRLGQRIGSVASDLPFELLQGAAQAVSAACDQWFIVHAANAGPKRRAEFARQVTLLMRRLLEPPAARARPAAAGAGRAPRKRARPRR
jgi:AcrR family transcriptional regulator